MQKFNENENVKSQLARFDRVMLRYSESKKIDGLSLKHQFVSLQKLMLNNHTLRMAKSFAHLREMTEPIKKLVRLPINKLSFQISSQVYKSESKRALSGIIEERSNSIFIESHPQFGML